MEIHIVVDGQLTVTEGHKIAKDVESCLIEDVENQCIYINGHLIKMIEGANPAEIDYESYGIKNAILHESPTLVWLTGAVMDIFSELTSCITGAVIEIDCALRLFPLI